METTRTWSKGRMAVAAHFALLGLVCATWGSSIDDAKLLLELGERELGWLLFSGPAGCLASFMFASALTARFESRSCLVLSTILYLASAAGGMACFLSRATFPFWCTATACLAATGNLFNISMNTQAGIVECRAERTIMGSFHAIFSLMCLVASLGTAAGSYLGIPPEWRLSAVLVIAVVVHLSFLRWLPKDDGIATKPGRGRLRMPDAQLLVVGLAALVVIACEGAINNWVGVFYHDSPRSASWTGQVGLLRRRRNDCSWTILGRSPRQPAWSLEGLPILFASDDDRHGHRTFFSVSRTVPSSPRADGDRRIWHRRIRHLGSRTDSVFKSEQDILDAGCVRPYLRQRNGLCRLAPGLANDRMPCKRHQPLCRHWRICRADSGLRIYSGFLTVTHLSL